MLKKRKPPTPIGYSEELPEGIFGDICEPQRPPSKKTKKMKLKLKLKKAKAKSKFVIPEIKPRNRERVVSREMFGFSPEHQIEIPIDKEARKARKLRKAKLKAKKLRDLAIRPPKKAPTYKAKANGILPDFAINYDSVLPKEARGLPLQNVVRMTEDVLKQIIANTETTTTELSELMLNRIAPNVLSFDASSSYVRAVLSSGLKIETELDRGVLEVVEKLSQLEVISFYIDRMRLPKAMRELLLQKFIEGISTSSLEAMVKAKKSDEMSQQIRELDAVLVKRSERQQQDAANGRPPAAARRRPKGPTPVDEIALPDSVRRSRRDIPRSGGF